MKRTAVLLLALALTTVAAPLGVEAQKKQVRVSRLGILTAGPPLPFEEELRRLGYTEGRNIVIERRYTHGSLEAPARLAVAILDFLPDVVLVSNGEMAWAIRRASRTMPVVVAAASDLVAQGFVKTLAKPGGNITGLQTNSTELAGKHVELIHEVVPRLARLAVLVPSPHRGGFASQRRDTEAAARTLGVHGDVLWVRERNDLAEAFKQVTSGRYDALYVYSNPFTYSERWEIARLARASRVPAIYEGREFVAAGGLMSYGPIVSILYRRAAVYVDKILKGAKPADLPVELPTQFELVINLKTAKTLKLTIPPSLLLRADQVIE